MQEKLNLLNQISDELNKDLNLDRMLQRVIDLTIKHFKAISGSIMLFDEENRVSKYILQRKDVSDARAHQIVGQVLTEGFAGWVLKHGKGDIINDTLTDDRWYTFPNQPYTARSVIATPLTRRNRVAGVLTINHSEAEHFKVQDLSLLNAIAWQAAIALENAQLFRQSEVERATLSAIINGTQDAIIVAYGEDHKILLMNPAAEKALQVTTSNWKGQALGSITYLDALVALFNSAPLNSGELQLSNGHTLLTSLIDVPDVGRMAIMHDISVLKALDKMKTEFIDTFTHDLAAPLATIKGHIDLLQIDGPLSDLQLEDLGFMRMAVDQMRMLIKDLLELTRLESLKSLYKTDIVLNSSLKKSFETFKGMATTKNIEFSLHANDSKAITRGNPTLITRAIDNLVENAIKYTKPHGQVSLLLTTSNNEALIAVKDTGIGIPAKTAPQVFDKFFRAHAAEANEVPGSGLGLSIVKTIVERHGGRVWVESKVNEGSTFTIALPIYSNGSANQNKK
jgi:signal transduction histidine kinase